MENRNRQSAFTVNANVRSGEASDGSSCAENRRYLEDGVRAQRGVRNRSGMSEVGGRSNYQPV